MNKKMIFTVLFASALMFSTHVQAKGIIENQLVNQSKSWTINFNQPVDILSARGNIILTNITNNSEEKNIRIEKGNNDKQVIVYAPTSGYEKGSRYELNVKKDVQSTINKKLEKDVKMNFNIRSNYDNSYGNTCGNTSNYSLAVKCGQFIYYSNENDNHKLYRLSLNTGEKTKVSNDRVFNLNVVDNYIYYVNISDKSTVYRMKVNETEGEKVLDVSVSSLNVVGDYMYFMNNSDNLKIYKATINGSQLKKLSDNSAYQVIVKDNWVYYMKLGKNYKEYMDSGEDVPCKICRVSVDGTDDTMLSEDNIQFINVSGDHIYFRDDTKGFILCKMNLDGSNLQTSNIVPLSINVTGDYVYYSNSSGRGDYIKKIKVDGIEEGHTLNLGVGLNLHIIDENIIYVDQRDGIMYKMNKNGEQKEKL